jgi:hypothetical protein
MIFGSESWRIARSASSVSARSASSCGAASALERLSRDHPGDVNDVRSLLHELVASDDNEAVRRLAVAALKNGSARPDTIQILTSLGSNDDEPRELREAAAKVAQLLRRKGK